MQQDNKYDDPEAIGYLTSLVSQAMICSLEREFTFRNIDLPNAQFMLLAQLFICDGQTQQQLSHNMSKDKASIKRTVDNLIKRGLIIKGNINDNAFKNIPLFVTPKALELKELLLLISSENFGVVTNGISQTDLDTTRETLRHVLENIRNSISR